MAGDVLPSAKTRAIKAQLLVWMEEDPDAKIIIYTQFLGMVDILGRMCESEGWGYAKFTGKMSQDARDNAIQDFDTNKRNKILLASLRAGGIGLNLVMASRVIIVDPWYASLHPS